MVLGGGGVAGVPGPLGGGGVVLGGGAWPRGPGFPGGEAGERQREQDILCLGTQRPSGMVPGRRGWLALSSATSSWSPSFCPAPTSTPQGPPSPKLKDQLFSCP